MPEICRFYGIIIRMQYKDHYPPHFHAEYGEHTAAVRIENPTLLNGRLPPRVAGLVVEWASRYGKELKEAWERAQQHEPPGHIKPLD